MGAACRAGITEHRGHASPHALQHLLARAVWDAEAIRDDLRGYVIDHLGHEDAIVLFDETGDIKKGVETVGVQRQYTGTPGKIENSQLTVYLTYASRHGHAFNDRALYLPTAWTVDTDRLTTFVRVAGQRWRIEESFQAAKNLVGLYQHQLRHWSPWHRWSTLAMLAHAFLTAAPLAERRASPTPEGLIELTIYEFRHLFVALLLTARTSTARLLVWSRWRPRHQARARDSHYRRQEHHR